MAANAEDVQPEASKQSNEQQREALREAMRGIIGALENEANQRVGKRNPIEKRWLEDLRQYHGQYAPDIATDLKDNQKSSVFMNQTRQKTNAMEARLSDMLFPTDDKNWGVGPTPVPELTVGAEQAAMASAAASTAAAADPQNPQLQQAKVQANDAVVKLEAEMSEARKRARCMEEEIDDHLTECNYSAQSRLVIRDACKLGTGVMKGPMTDGKSRRSWQKSQDPTQPNVYTLNHANDPRPAFWRVDPWNYFPDTDATNAQDGESDFERHLFNKKQMRRMARQQGFDKDAIRRLLQSTPQASTPTYLTDLRAITSEFTSMIGDRYHVWEYHGPLTAQDLETLSTASGDSALMEDVGEVDELDELQVVIWFCQGELLKLGIHHLDSGDPIYSVFNLEKDEASPFGFGVPYIIRDPQKVFAATWRTTMDNMGLSSGPQIVVNTDVVEPVDGKYILTPRKVWLRKNTASPDKKPFEIFNIDSHLSELLELIEVTKKAIDEESALPLIAQGDQGSQITKTMGGMSILMNSANVIFRRIVKNWDDDMTVPNITRMYDWLMQFSPKESIKGDYEIDARGTSVLLVREMQSTNLLAFLVHFGDHPKLAKYLKKDGLFGLRRLAQVMMIPADEIVKSDDEVARDEAKAANAPPPPNPEMEKIAMTGNIERERGKTQLEIEGMRRETALIILAGKGNMTLDTLKARLLETREKIASSERMMAVETAVTEKIGPSGGGNF